ncbi:MAG: hypothetical protein ACR2P4_02435 [Gammaproteobacteria bacterium]
MSFPRKRESNAAAPAAALCKVSPLQGFNYECAFCALRVLPNAAALPPFALSRKLSFGKDVDSRFRGNDEGGRE